MGFSRQEYWSGLPFPSPGDLANPGIEPGSPAVQANTLPSEPPGKHLQQRSTKVGQGFYSRRDVANRLNGSKDGSKSAREETPDTIRMMNYDRSNQDVAESLNAIRILKIELTRFTDKWMLRMRGRGIKNDSNGFWPKQTKGRIAAKMGTSVEGVGLNKLILSNLLDN